MYHAEDRLLLGMMWEDSLYVDSALPFGLRSAPKIFTAVADALEWIAKQEGLESTPPDLEKGKAMLDQLLGLFERLRVPVALNKLEGPHFLIVFLVIEIDTVAMVLRLPKEKIEELNSLIREWLEKKFSTKKELQSLVGKLQHACRVVRPSKTFLKRMLEG